VGAGECGRIFVRTSCLGLTDHTVLYFPLKQKLYDCRRVQSAVAVDLDKFRGHLYVLDSGYDNCQPKIIVYDLKTYKCVRIYVVNIITITSRLIESITLFARLILQERTQNKIGWIFSSLY
jgi:hypothetical protein